MDTRLVASDEEDLKWWRQAAVYQIYPRSFADGNSDGIGDLSGLISRIPYLQELGIDAVWISPFYPSALADGGYDVDDYRDIDPRIGTLDEFDALVDSLHEAGIKVIIDIVPNHSSDRHEWFRAALTSPIGSPERDRYVFRDGLGENREQPPSDWGSAFGGSMWEPVGDGQWYMHVFAKEQPDLNWNNREVRDDFLTTLRFWADRGVDGFRVDVAHGLAKHLPEVLPPQVDVPFPPLEGEHPYIDRNEVHEIYKEWRAVFDEYDPPRIGIAEAWAPTAERRARYASEDELGQAFNFDLLLAQFNAADFRRIVTENLIEAERFGTSMTWVLSNHDVTRHATRYGIASHDELSSDDPHPLSRDKQWLVDGAPASEFDPNGGLRRARAATLFMLGLPGSAYIYQGEELGLHEVVGIAPVDRQDPAFFRSEGREIGRDGCRVPLPWTSEGSSFGFGKNGTHLPQPSWFAGLSVEAQQADPSSTLNLYRIALEHRKRLRTEERLEWLDTGRDDVLGFRRPNGWQVIMNFGSESFPLDEERVIVASGPISRILPGETTAWLVEGEGQ
ncbi:MAG: glycoside hydrolase family 13 protein [Ancrocorticia sp.]